jgi:hypothetical protein
MGGGEHMRLSGSEDKLACLLQAALKARVSGQEPPKIVWRRIKLELEKDNESLSQPCDGRDLVDARGSVI